MQIIYNNSLYCDDLKTALNNVLDIECLTGKSILITGATGLIGSYITDMLCLWNSLQNNTNKKIHIYGCSRKLQNLERRFNGCYEREYLHFIEQDFTKNIHFRNKVEYIIHAASNAYPAAFNQEPVETILSNINGTSNLLSYAYEKNVKRMLFVSTGEIYGEAITSTNAFDEEYSGYIDILNPRSCYPMAKRTAETLCMSYVKQFGLDVVVARLCHTYGPNVTESDNRATVQFMNNAVNGEKIVLKSSGNQLRSYCYIADCASAILSILTAGEKGQAYNIADSKTQVTIAEYARILAAIANTEVMFQLPDAEIKKQFTPISKAVLEPKKLEMLGWSARFDIEKGISHTFNILKSLK